MKKRLKKPYHRPILNRKYLEQWEKTNKILEEIKNAMRTQKKPVEKILEYGGSGVGILGIFAIIDIIKNWITGG